jgi:hypothetical protein
VSALTAEDAFTEWITGEVSEFMRSRGYRRAGKMFRDQAQDIWKVVEFQKSRKSTATRVVFTINLGITSKAVAKFLNPLSDVMRPTIQDCHWTVRLGELLTPPRDAWWHYEHPPQPADNHTDAFGLLRDLALPLLDQMSSDDALIALWRSGEAPGLTDLQRLIFASILLCKKKATAELNEFVDEMRKTSAGKKSAASVASHIARLRDCS